MLKSGGDGMTMFNGCNTIKDEVMVDVDVLSSYIQGLGGSVSSEYENPEDRDGLWSGKKIVLMKIPAEEMELCRDFLRGKMYIDRKEKMI